MCPVPRPVMCPVPRAAVCPATGTAAGAVLRHRNSPSPAPRSASATASPSGRASPPGRTRRSTPVSVMRCCPPPRPAWCAASPAPPQPRAPAGVPVGRCCSARCGRRERTGRRAVRRAAARGMPGPRAARPGRHRPGRPGSPAERLPASGRRARRLPVPPHPVLLRRVLPRPVPLRRVLPRPVLPRPVPLHPVRLRVVLLRTGRLRAGPLHPVRCRPARRRPVPFRPDRRRRSYGRPAAAPAVPERWARVPGRTPWWCVPVAAAPTRRAVRGVPGVRTTLRSVVASRPPTLPPYCPPRLLPCSARLGPVPARSWLPPTPTVGRPCPKSRWYGACRWSRARSPTEPCPGPLPAASPRIRDPADPGRTPGDRTPVGAQGLRAAPRDVRLPGRTNGAPRRGRPAHGPPETEGGRRLPGPPAPARPSLPSSSVRRAPP